ncbi:MAG TPA: deoxyribonuclease IV [Candidatus Blautia faecigallinarum]|uniref:Probable endonuclease 4 n=1 Tax=Candidatus Blautia faecigallinarum TaxID=2838488 RepID=A0A9D2DUZ9_9FIRM|nr:deoxyribonuclease IV [Candidatus Blautia faecigallinarum]
MLYIGNHTSSSKGYEAMAKQMIKNGGNTFAFFTRNPRGGKAKDIDPADVEKFRILIREQGFGKLVAHAPYTLNACAAKENLRVFAKETMAEDLNRMELIPGNYYNFHPGSHVGQGTQIGIEKIADVLNTVLTNEQSTTVLLETMAGKGSEVGGTFEEIKEILDLVEKKDKMGVCLDTCHVWDGGYDIADHLDEVLEEFDRVIGLKRLKAIHLNDSQNEMGSHKDRHARIGEGKIGLKALARVVCHPALEGIPFILETPNDDDGWTAEIALLKDQYAAGLEKRNL